MAEYKTNNSNLGEVLYGSVVGVGKLVGDFLQGALVLPVTSLIIPTFVRALKSQFKEAKEEGVNPLSGKDFKDWLSTKPFQGIGAVTGGFLIGQFADEAYHFVSEHPYTLAVPILTNLLSAGYERYKFDKEKGLEEKLE